jgi:hypothetical protein
VREREERVEEEWAAAAPGDRADHGPSSAPPPFFAGTTTRPTTVATPSTRATRAIEGEGGGSWKMSANDVVLLVDAVYTPK